MTKRLSAAVAAMLIVSLIGCGTSPIEILNLAVGALEIALPLIGPAAGIDPSTTTAVENYLSATSQAITQASDILSGPGTDAQKAAAITAAFAGIAAPIVPARYQAIASAVQQIAQYVAKFLATLPTPSSTNATSETHTLSASNRQKVLAVKARAQAVQAKLKR